MQKELHRAFCLLKYGEDNVRRLTNEDREAAEIVVNVEDGSSKFGVDLDEQLNNIILALVNKMDPHDLLYGVLGVALIFATHSAWKLWLANKAREKEIDLPLRMSEEETKRTQIMAGVIARSEPIRAIAEGMDEVRNHTLYRMKAEDRFSLPESDVEVDGHIASQLSHVPRAESAEIRIDGEFKIYSVDSGNMSGYRIKVYRLFDGLELTVRIPDNTLGMREREILKEAEWNKTRVIMQINARELRGKISGATLVSVSIPSQEPPPNANLA